MNRCDCIDPDRHGHVDYCPFSHVDEISDQLNEALVLLREASDNERALYDADGEGCFGQVLRGRIVVLLALNRAAVSAFSAQEEK